MTLFNWRNLLNAVAVTGLLAACSSSPEPDYAELGEFDQQVTPSVAWRANIGSGTDEHYSALSPTYADGVVYAADRQGLVTAVNAESGRRVWRLDISPSKPFSLFSVFKKGPPARVSGGLVYDNGILYFGTENGRMYAVDAENGSINWEVNVPGEVISAPAVGEGNLVAHLGNGLLVALDIENGEERWRHEEEVPPLSLRGTSQPIINSGGVIVGTNNGRAAVLILESGQLAWDERVATPSGSSDLDRIVDIDASPVVLGDTIYMLAFNGELIAMELRSGSVVWRRDYNGYRTPQVTGNRIFVTTSDSHVVSLERMGGNERWRNNDLYGRSLTEVAITQNYLVTADRFGYVHWLDRESGRLVGRYEASSDGVRVAPLRVDDKIIVQTVDGRLIALAL